MSGVTVGNRPITILANDLEKLMKRTRILAVPLAVSAVAVAAAACGDSADQGQAAGTAPAHGPAAHAPTTHASVKPAESAGPVTDQDRTWLTETKQGNLAEISAGDLARRKGVSQNVRSIGAMLVQDHSALDGKLGETARQVGVELPSQANQEQLHEADELRRSSGRQFDRDWIGAMVKAHRTAIDGGQREIAHGSNPQVVALAKAAAPNLRKHLDMLQKAEGS